VSANETSATARPPMAAAVRSSNGIQGIESAGSPCGSDPSVLTLARACKVEDLDDRSRPDDGEQHAGKTPRAVRVAG
jgi:hypothetical protein